VLQASGSQAGPGMDACIIYEAAVDQVEEGGGGGGGTGSWGGGEG